MITLILTPDQVLMIRRSMMHYARHVSDERAESFLDLTRTIYKAARSAKEEAEQAKKDDLFESLRRIDPATIPSPILDAPITDAPGDLFL